MRYSITLRTYDPSDCASTGYHIQANRTTVRVASRSCWQGSREHVWLVRCPAGNGLEVAKEMAEWENQPEHEKDGVTMEENWGLDHESASRVGPSIR